MECLYKLIFTSNYLNPLPYSSPIIEAGYQGGLAYESRSKFYENKLLIITRTTAVRLAFK